MHLSLVTAVCLTLTAAPAAAQTLAPLPRDLTTVATGGYWEADHRSGQYRIVVLTSGYEIHTSTVFVQWLYDAGGEADTIQVVATVPLAEINDSDLVVGNIRFEYSRHRGTIATLDATGMDTPLRQHEEWMITLGAPGRYTTRRIGLVADHPRL